MLFSFYYTDKIALMVQNNNPIMKEIKKEKEILDVASVNALIEDDKIIPGRNGLSVNTQKSFGMMKSFSAFNSYYLVYDEVKPDVSIENNKDKVIYKGNNLNKYVSIILSYDENIINYFETKNIKASVLVNYDNYKNISKLDLINNDINNYKRVENILSGRKSNNICVLYDNNLKDLCIKNNKYLVSSDIVLNNQNIIDVKSKIGNGSIIIIEANTSLEYLDILINNVKFKGLEIVDLTRLISEENKK